MKAEIKHLFETLTSWILTAISAIVPKPAGGWMGTTFLDRRIHPINLLPLIKFSPTSEISSPFFPYIRYTTYDILLPRAPRPLRSNLLPRCSDPASSGWFLVSSRSVLASWCWFSFPSGRTLFPSGPARFLSNLTLSSWIQQSLPRENSIQYIVCRMSRRSQTKIRNRK